MSAPKNPPPPPVERKPRGKMGIAIHDPVTGETTMVPWSEPADRIDGRVGDDIPNLARSEIGKCTRCGTPIITIMRRPLCGACYDKPPLAAISQGGIVFALALAAIVGLAALAPILAGPPSECRWCVAPAAKQGADR